MNIVQLPAQLQCTKELSEGGQAKIYLGTYEDQQVAVKAFQSQREVSRAH